MKGILTEKHHGVVAFEYILMIAIMSAALFAGLKELAGMYEDKNYQLSEVISSNGQNGLSSPSDPPADLN